MPYRTPARWLAPLSLAAFVVAVLVILGGGSEDPARSDSQTASTSGRPVGQTTSTGSSSSKARRRRSTYTVRSGDVLSAIAQRTGVSVERLLELNPDIDAQTLRVGQRLKLRE